MNQQRGFTYLLLLFMVALLAISLLAVGTLAHYARVRSDEAELLRIGARFRHAIASYHNAVEPRTYPVSLDDLLLDRRNGVLRRHLRKIYIDPMTRGRDWGLVKEGAGIVGVHSLSDRHPMKVAGFDPQDAALEGAERYSDWVFSPINSLPSQAGSTSLQAGNADQVPVRNPESKPAPAPRQTGMAW
jgi:type II secretory pathway pseudopilin PulG